MASATAVVCLLLPLLLLIVTNLRDTLTLSVVFYHLHRPRMVVVVDGMSRRVRTAGDLCIFGREDKNLTPILPVSSEGCALPLIR